MPPDTDVVQYRFYRNVLPFFYGQFMYNIISFERKLRNQSSVEKKWHELSQANNIFIYKRKVAAQYSDREAEVLL